jgi:glycosyltransferase involved in cell wall biosynthesis
MTRVLIGSPVRQDPEILRRFLEGLRGLNTEGLFIEYWFVDDNDSEESFDLLHQFCHESPEVRHLYTRAKRGETAHDVSEVTHQWTDENVWRVAEHKDRIIEWALKGNYTDNIAFDYLMLVDSDLVLHPQTLQNLIRQDKDIVSEVFWTRWTPQSPLLPQVWMGGHYDLTQSFIDSLKAPGLYEVGGLGACTLISRKALEAGVRFAKLDGCDMWGEDRHFCKRATALGFDLWADTHYPPHHIYRKSELEQPRICLSMLVRNEADRYLRRVLASAVQYIDEAVIIDDGSTDDTVAVCVEALQGIPHRIIRHEESGFDNEAALRRLQWDAACETRCDWILTLDADEELETRARIELKPMLKATGADVIGFRLYDMWSGTEYREDEHWQAHTVFRPFLVRNKGIDPTFPDMALHCGRFPASVGALATQVSSIKIQHWGWATEADRQAKHARYLAADPKGKWGSKPQYDSILDPAPTLKPFAEVKPVQVSLCMIVKNEAEHLHDCLESVRGAVDEIIVVDTGSTDDTVSIAEAHGAQVRGFIWCNDFAAARNFAIEQASGKWILILDADETLAPESVATVRHIAEKALRGIYQATILNDVGGGNETRHETSRMFPNDPLIRYHGKIHELPHDMTGETPAAKIEKFPFIIHHKGYHPDMVKARNKNQRNMGLIAGRIGRDPLDPNMRIAMATELRGTGNHLEAIDQLRVAMHVCKISGADAAFYEQAACDLVGILVEIGQVGLSYHEAKLAYVSVERPITHPGYWINAASAMYHVKDYRAAIESAANSIANAGAVTLSADAKGLAWKPHHIAGMSYAALGEHEQAQEAFAKALDCDMADGDRQEVLRQMAQVEKVTPVAA